MIPLTQAQAETARALAELTTALRRVPTLDELAAELGINRSNAHHALRRLADRGWLDPERRLRAPPPPRRLYEVELTALGKRYVEAVLK
ncbi:MAG: helix-turn-helix domain-containing protein [Rhodospirillales bacterium]|nr:helix-turn-helix domain-containing protein [Rhodospirillales bacterium]MDH3912424.1 helix-turn-helix domain-containing protein [Rhodospirillales bacterium]